MGTEKTTAKPLENGSIIQSFFDICDFVHHVSWLYCYMFVREILSEWFEIRDNS